MPVSDEQVERLISALVAVLGEMKITNKQLEKIAQELEWIRHPVKTISENI